MKSVKIVVELCFDVPDDISESEAEIAVKNWLKAAWQEKDHILETANLSAKTEKGNH